METKVKEEIKVILIKQYIKVVCVSLSDFMLLDLEIDTHAWEWGEWQVGFLCKVSSRCLTHLRVAGRALASSSSSCKVQECSAPNLAASQ